MENIRTATRIRPLFKAGDAPPVCEARSDSEVIVRAESRSVNRFLFDRVFDESATQEQVFSFSQCVLDGSLQGIDGCIFVYGQSGGGKTYTMFGPEHMSTDFTKHAQTIPADAGLIPRAAHDLFQRFDALRAEKKAEIRCELQMLELYNEKWFDLLASDQEQALELRNDGERFYVKGANTKKVTSTAEFLEAVQIGWASRRTESTRLNARSSRSHAILQIEIEIEVLDDNSGQPVSRSAYLHLIDLAGSERLHTQAQTPSKERANESSSINKSLTTLGICIRRLVEIQHLPPKQRAAQHVPYRSSQLTSFLETSLGGNARTSVIANVRADAAHVSETLSTLRFAEDVKKVKKTVTAHETVANDGLLAARAEISRLKRKLARTEEELCAKNEAIANSEREKVDLKQKLLAANALLSTRCESEVSEVPPKRRRRTGLFDDSGRFDGSSTPLSLVDEEDENVATPLAKRPGLGEEQFCQQVQKLQEEKRRLQAEIDEYRMREEMREREMRGIRMRLDLASQAMDASPNKLKELRSIFEDDE